MGIKWLSKPIKAKVLNIRVCYRMQNAHPSPTHNHTHFFHLSQCTYCLVPRPINRKHILCPDSTDCTHTHTHSMGCAPNLSWRGKEDAGNGHSLPCLYFHWRMFTNNFTWFCLLSYFSSLPEGTPKMNTFIQQKPQQSFPLHTFRNEFKLCFNTLVRKSHTIWESGSCESTFAVEECLMQWHEETRVSQLSWKQTSGSSYRFEKYSFYRHTHTVIRVRKLSDRQWAHEIWMSSCGECFSVAFLQLFPLFFLFFLTLFVCPVLVLHTHNFLSLC